VANKTQVASQKPAYLKPAYWNLDARNLQHRSIFLSATAMYVHTSLTGQMYIDGWKITSGDYCQHSVP